MAQTIAPPPSAETYSAIGPMSVTPGGDDLELVFKRTIRAPREHVYAAFTDPELLSRWWGPEGYTVPVAETDPHPSGHYRLVMRAPDGTEYPVQGVFVQADEPVRVVMTDEAYELPQDWADLQHEYRSEDDTPLRMILRVLFEESEAGTELTIVSRFPSVEDKNAELQGQAAEGWSQSLEKLDRLLGGERQRR